MRPRYLLLVASMLTVEALIDSPTLFNNLARQRPVNLGQAVVYGIKAGAYSILYRRRDYASEQATV